MSDPAVAEPRIVSTGGAEMGSVVSTGVLSKDDDHGSSSSSVVVVASPPQPPPPPPSRPFDWYADPLYYDIIFQEDTAVETHMLVQLALRFGSSRRAEDGSGVRLCLEPACGSARLMLAFLDEMAIVSNDTWRVFGFDLSPGAVEFARQRWEEMEPRHRLMTRRRAELLRDEQPAGIPDEPLSATPTPPTDAIASVDAVSTNDGASPAFTVFEADMCEFGGKLASVEPAASPPARFDFAHCLVSSLKHLLDPRDVLAHFVQMHAALAPGGVYVVALHLHTLDGRSHFDRRVGQPQPPPSTTSTHADGDPSGVASVPTADSAEVAATAAAGDNDDDDDVLCDPAEVDDAFEKQYTRGDTRFRAELITYMPDTTTMIEKMIARVHLGESLAPSPDADVSTAVTNSSSSPDVAAAVSSSSSSPVVGESVETSMSLRVYSLSSLHTLLCTLSPLFALASCYSYSDIYEEEWTPEEFELTYPFPPPSLDQLRAPNEPPPTKPAIPSPRMSTRNWSRVYAVPKQVREEWEDVDAVVIVLRRTPDETPAADDNAPPSEAT